MYNKLEIKILSIFQDIGFDIGDPNMITLDTTYDELGLDSLDEVEIMLSIELLFNIVIIIVFGLLVYSFIQFFNTDLTNELIKWSLAIVIGLFMISMLKMFLWMQMDKNSIKRELKRLELQVSNLSSKLS